MADMASLEQVEVCWEELASCTDARIVPITYINSTAAIKAFVGRNGGAVCTSSNARKVMEWRWRTGKKLCFFRMNTSGGTLLTAWGYLSTRWPCGTRTRNREG